MTESGATLTSPRYPLALARTSKPLCFFFDFACVYSPRMIRVVTGSHGSCQQARLMRSHCSNVYNAALSSVVTYIIDCLIHPKLN